MVLGVRAHVFSAARLHGDDTTVPVLAKGRTRIGRVWGYVRDDRPFGGPDPPAVAFFYSPDRRGEHPERHLAGFVGILQADAYAGFDRLYDPEREPGPILEAACWAHARRKLFEIAAVSRAPIAAEAVRRIDELFAIEREINGRPAGERLAVRKERTRPLVGGLEAWLRVQHARVSPKSETGKAVGYALNHWKALTRFLEDGRICMSNNAAERAPCGIAVGRRNWTFAGSDRGGERAAAIYTLVETCSRVGDWRGGGRTRGVAVGRRLSPAAGASVRAVAPSPVAARQTGRAACPHPAFTCVLKPSRSAGRHGGVAGGRGRAPRTGARPGIGGNPGPAPPPLASNLAGPPPPRTPAPGRRGRGPGPCVKNPA